MSAPIKIGFLSTYSGVYPELNLELVEGFVLAYVKEHSGERLFEFIPEYVHQGNVKAVSEAAKKLIHFHQVDVLTGLVSYKVIPEVISLIESRKKIGFFFDLGEYIPSEKLLSPRVFFNSFQLWQAEYALGYWAHKEFGDKGMVLMPLYEAGYQMHAAFRQGTVRAGSEAIDYHLLPYLEGQSQVSHHVDHFLDSLKINLPSYLHVLFSGTEATEFLAKFYSCGLAGKIPLLISPVMAQEEWLNPVAHIAGSFYSASVWNPRSSEPANQNFVQAYRSATGQNPSLFLMLGYEMGLVFKELLPQFQKRDWAAIIQFLQQETLYGPRGPVNFWPQSGFALPTIDIEKIILTNAGDTRVVVGGGNGLLYNSPAFHEIHQETQSGWQNPYMCV